MLLRKEDADKLTMTQREDVLRGRGCPKVPPQYVIVWTDPEDEGNKVTVISPSPRWLGYVMHGYYTCSIEDQLTDIRIKTKWANNHPEVGFAWDKSKHKALHPYAPTIGPITEEEAMEYLVKITLPERIWSDTTSNSPRFVICSPSQIPIKTYRNAWRMAA